METHSSSPTSSPVLTLSSLPSKSAAAMTSAGGAGDVAGALHQRRLQEHLFSASSALSSSLGHTSTPSPSHRPSRSSQPSSSSNSRSPSKPPLPSSSSSSSARSTRSTGHDSNASSASTTSPHPGPSSSNPTVIPQPSPHPPTSTSSSHPSSSRDSSHYTITSPFPMRLPDYSDATKIFESKHTIVYHATRVSDGLEVVLKVPNSRNPGRSRLVVFGQQFDLLKSIEAQAHATESEPVSAASDHSRSSHSSHHSGSQHTNNSTSNSTHSHSLTPAQQHSSLQQGVIRAYDLISIHNTLVLVCEYFHGPSLHSYLSTAQYSNGFPLVEFLCVGIKMSHVLYDIHQMSIIHKDITASNILYNRTTREIKVIDLGLAAIAPLGAVSVKKITQLVGTMAYISPEQTGRVSRSIDYRTDLSATHSPATHSTLPTPPSLLAHLPFPLFTLCLCPLPLLLLSYSLGVVLYQLATGCLPFSTDDSLEFLHMIIAKAPIPPHAIKPSLPVVVSNIIIKLLSKNADDRYQSAWGVRADLARVLNMCLAQRGVAGACAPGTIPAAADDSGVLFPSPSPPHTPSKSPATSRSSSAAASMNPYTHERAASYSSNVDFGSAIASNTAHSSLTDEPDQVQAIMDADLLLTHSHPDDQDADSSSTTPTHDPSRTEFLYDIPSFSLAAHDIVTRLNIPQRLFGREKEGAELLSSIDELFATGRSTVVCVTGAPGMGKSVLVQSILDALQDRRTMFASARCEQVNRMPYDCLIQLVNELVLKILSRPSAKVKAWKERLLHALHTNAQLITGICTTLESILGPQPPVPYLQAAEAVHRLNLTFVRFMCAFATKRKPLVLMIDDLQWADSASLKMIQLIVSDSACHHLLLILSFRDHLMTPEHRVQQTIQRMVANGVPVRNVPMLPLPLHQVNALISETLGCSPERSLPLSSIILTKSDGNPFAVTQLIMSLHADHLLFFSIDPSQPDAKGQWYWSEEALQSRELTTDVLQLVLRKVQLLPSTVQKVLKFAACIDGRFDVDTLCAISGLSRHSVLSALSEPIKQELILQVRVTAATLKAGQLADDIENDAKHTGEREEKEGKTRKKKRSKVEGRDSEELSSDESDGPEPAISPATASAQPLSLAKSGHRSKQALFGERLVYQFLHERVQQACYSLMEDREKTATHLKVARYLYEQYLHEQQAAANAARAKSSSSSSPTGKPPSAFTYSSASASPTSSGRSLSPRNSSAKLDELLWAVVHHYKHGIHALDPADDTTERLLIAQLNLHAGKKAKMTGSVQQALAVIATGMEVLGFRDIAQLKKAQTEPSGASPYSPGSGGEGTPRSGGSAGGGYSKTHTTTLSPIVVGRQLAGRTRSQADEKGAKEESAMWEMSFDIVFPLFMERADCEHLLGHAVEAEHYLQVALEHVHSDDDTLLVLHRLISHKTNVGDFAAALVYGRRCLMILDVPFPLVSPQPPQMSRPALSGAGLLTSVPFAPSTASALISASSATISSSAGYQVLPAVSTATACTTLTASTAHSYGQRTLTFPRLSLFAAARPRSPPPPPPGTPPPPCPPASPSPPRPPRSTVRMWARSALPRACSRSTTTASAASWANARCCPYSSCPPSPTGGRSWRLRASRMWLRRR